VTGAWAGSIDGRGHCEDDGNAGRIARVVLLLLLLLWLLFRRLSVVVLVSSPFVPLHCLLLLRLLLLHDVRANS
jgi:hypothetical protein